MLKASQTQQHANFFFFFYNKQNNNRTFLKKGMDKQESLLVPAMRSAKKKRASESPVHSQPLSTTKKRAVLADLTNSPTSVESIRNSGFVSKKPIAKLKRKEDDQVPPKTKQIRVTSLVPYNFAYSNSIYKHLHALQMEVNRRPLADYMETVQNDVSSITRGILVDWLVEVAQEYKLVSDTLYLTVSYIDRFLSSHAVNKNKIQLLGISCMLLASKYEEITPPNVEDFCYITDNTYTKEEVVDMERDVLKLLNFDMGTPTTKIFLRTFTRVAQAKCKSCNLQFELLGCYLAELSLLDYGCVRFFPSVVAASAIFLSRLTIQPEMHPWSLALQCYSGYKPYDLKECVLAIQELQLGRKGSSLQAVRNKYMQHKHNCVATLSSPSEIPVHYFEVINE